MKYFPLVWATLWHKKVRTFLALLSIVVAFFLYGVLKTLDSTFSGANSGASASMLVTANKYSIGLPLPSGALQRIRDTPGIRDASLFAAFPAYFQEPQNQVPAIAVDQGTYFQLYRDELAVPADIQAAFGSQRNAILVGVDQAQLHGWKKGDRITLRAPAAPQADGNIDWTFEVVGLMDGKDPATRASHAGRLVIRYDYFDEARAFDKGTVSWFMATIDDPDKVAQVGAAIDAKFANSASETHTQSGQEFTVLFLKQVGDITSIMRAILAAVFFTLLLMTGNTMMQAVRERSSEMAALKALGFSNGKVMAFVVAEALLLCLLGAALGLGLSYLALPAIELALQGIDLAPDDLLPAFGFAVLVALITSLPPAVRALRLNIVDALAGKR